jgi:hypothetical protein
MSKFVLIKGNPGHLYQIYDLLLLFLLTVKYENFDDTQSKARVNYTSSASFNFVSSGSLFNKTIVVNNSNVSFDSFWRYLTAKIRIR